MVLLRPASVIIHTFSPVAKKQRYAVDGPNCGIEVAPTAALKAIERAVGSVATSRNLSWAGLTMPLTLTKPSRLFNGPLACNRAGSN